MKNKFKLFIVFSFINSFIYSQKENIIFNELPEKEYKRELIFIKEIKFKKILENIINENNYCYNRNLVWSLNEKNDVYYVSLFHKNTISDFNVKYITSINDFVVYVENLENIKIKKSNLKVNFQGGEEIYFQDFSYWIIIKENDEFIIRKEVINCK